MKVYRIGSAAHPVFDGRGAALHPGRWNDIGHRAIYCGTSFAIRMLERLCYTAIGRIPSNDLYVEIELPDALVEFLDERQALGWDSPDQAVARAAGSHWFAELRSVGLSVPSAVSKLDRNLVLNQDHPRFAEVIASPERPVNWDRRLFLR